MARILLISSDEAIREKTRRALDGSKHELAIVDDFPAGSGHKEVAEAVSAHQPEVVLTAYRGEDAASVKLMQSLGGDSAIPGFIFIDEGGRAGREEVMLAFNEGAEAFLNADFSPQALANYIGRAVNGPGRLRWHLKEDDSDQIDRGLLEEALGSLRIKTDRFQKLIAHILSTPVSAAMRKTLVVSDSPFQRDLLKKILEEHNFPTLIAPGFDEGLKLALDENPRIIVSDFELAGRTGLELCRALKFEHKIIPCHFVICTASQDKADQVMTPGNGVDDCLLKPSGRGDSADFISRVALGLLL